MLRAWYFYFPFSPKSPFTYRRNGIAFLFNVSKNILKIKILIIKIYLKACLRRQSNSKQSGMVLSSHYKKKSKLQKSWKHLKMEKKVNFDAQNYLIMKMVDTLVKPICGACQYLMWHRPCSLRYVLKTVGRNFCKTAAAWVGENSCNSCAVVSRCGLLHVSDVTDADHFWQCWYLLAIFRVPAGHLHIFFEKNVYSYLLPIFLIKVCCVFCCWVIWILYIFGY